MNDPSLDQMRTQAQQPPRAATKTGAAQAKLPDAAPPTPPAPMSSRSLAGRKLVLLLVATLTIMAGIIIAPSLPAIESRFGDSDHIALLSRMVLTLPSLFVAMSAPLAGILADRYGRKKLLVGAIALYGIAGASGLIADSLPMLLTGRAILGIAIGGIITLNTALIGDYFTGAEREKYLGLQQAFVQLGGVVFVMSGGLLAELHWRMPFVIYGAALILIPAVIIFLTEPQRLQRKQSRQTITALTSVPANWPVVAAVCLLAFLINVSFYTVPSQLQFHMKGLGIYDASAFGMVLAAFNLAGGIAALCFGRLKRRLDTAVIFLAGLSLMAAGFGLLSVASHFPGLVLANVIMGAGLGIAIPNVFSTAISHSPASLRGRIAGMVATSIFIGQFISPFLSQYWVSVVGYADMFRNVGLIMAALALFCILPSLRNGWLALTRQRTSYRGRRACRPPKKADLKT
ncbi:MFS transporter [Advenella sp. S44]|uniref:MFS transporter n=1 Tax=Advenella sp. S44 TaxID=1982755 RepID=UPI0018D50E88|nr:MFS transporter [Advenella sp. S44]